MSQYQQQEQFRLRRFCIIGMVIASLEEFISQGVLKHNLIGWIIPTIIAFLPFLVGTAFIYRFLQKRLRTANRRELVFYTIAGIVGLMFEWFLIGLVPWKNSGTDPVLTILFQMALFSFWGSVAFAPRILLDKRILVTGLVKWFKRFLVAGLLLIYMVTLGSGRQSQFIAGIFSIMTVFLLLNIFYFRYIRSWGRFTHGAATKSA